MKLTKDGRFGAGGWMGLVLEVCLLTMACSTGAMAQAVSTTTVQGTVFLANGHPGAGSMDVSWPAFTTANNQAVIAGRLSVTIAADGFVSVNLTPNQGATPAGLYYTVVYHMSDGSTSTEYWIVPSAAQASLAQVRAQIMPAVQAVQAVNKAYVDQAIAALPQSQLSISGGTLTGPLYLNADPTQSMQAADKHYVDSTASKAVPVTGGTMTGPLEVPAVNDVESPQAASSQATLQAAVTAAGTNGAVEIPPTYAGTDGFTNPNGVYVKDLRQGVAQQSERSVKEFGAVCDGVTDDTNALQTAIDYAQTRAVSLLLPQGTCKTRTLAWHGESLGGLGKQVSALKGYPGQDVLAGAVDTPSFLANTRLHDLTIYVDVSVDVSCSTAKARAPAGSCRISRPVENNSIFSPGANGLNGTAGAGAAWSVGNCAIALPAATGAGGNSLNVATIENIVIAATGTDPMAQYAGASSTHTCGLYLAQWPKWTEFRNIDIRSVNTGIAMPALPGTAPAGLNADSNRWQNIDIEAAHGFTAGAGSNNDLDNVVAMAGNSAATGETPTGVILDLAGSQQGWTIRNAVVLPAWNAVQPQLTVTAAGGAVTRVSVGADHGLGFDPYGTQIPLAFSGSCTAQAVANVNSDGSIGAVDVTKGGAGCSGGTSASLSAAGTWDTAAPVNLIAGQNMTVLSGNLLKGNGGYTVWNAVHSQSYGAKWGGGGVLPGGGSYPALVASSGLGSTNQADQFEGADFGARLQACLGALSTTFGGTCDARNFTGSLSMGSNLTISMANVTVLLPCATIATASQIIVAAGARNVSLRGCALRGGSTASGSQGGTAFLYSGAGAMVQVGDPAYVADTNGFHMDNVAIDTTASASASAVGLVAYRTQELDLESLYFLGNQNQTGMTLDGTGNYTGGTFLDNAFTGFQTAVNAIGHQISNAATTDWMNASTFVRLHIDCPTSGGNPIPGTYGVNLQQGDGNTFTGGDVEGCSTALHLGANAQNNTIVGLRNENSSSQIVADAGSAYNNWITGGTMFTGKLTDNGTRNSFLDTFHRSFNGMNGDWYGSQQDATVTNHYRLGTGTGNERGLLNRYQTDYGYRWTEGFSDASAGEQFYQLLDELNDVYRLSVGQYNSGQSSTNNQTAINSAGTGAVVLNGSTNAGTGGVVFGSGGANETTVATIGNAGDAQFNGTLQVGGTTTFTGSTTVRNQADAEIDQFLWAGAAANQKESLIYKDYAGNSQWYLVKDTSNNWALNSAVGGLDSFKAYQSTNSGDTYIDASNTSGVVRVNYEPGSGSGFNIYGGGSTSPLYASFTGTAAIKFPGLAASSGHNCLQIDNSGYLTNTGTACGTGSGSGTVTSGAAGQIAYYTATGSQVGGISAVPVTAGGTGATTAAGALASLGGLPLSGGTLSGALNGASASFSGAVQASALAGSATNGVQTVPAGGSIQAAINAAGAGGAVELTPGASYTTSSTITMPYNAQTLSFRGATLTCNATGDCIQVSGTNVTIDDAYLVPGTASTGASIHDTSPLALTLNRPRWGEAGSNTPAGGYYWDYGVQVDTDELLTINGIDGPYGVLRCDSTFCGAGVYNPAGVGAAVLYMFGGNLSTGCQGNGIDWQGGNDLRLDGMQIQSYNQFGVRFNYTVSGADLKLLTSKVHNEAGACVNPTFGIPSSAGYIMQAGTLEADQGQLGGVMPVFSVNGTHGTTNYAYYVAASGTGGKSLPLPAGSTTGANATISSTNSVNVVFPCISNATSYDLLRVNQTSAGRVAPNGTGNYAVATGLTCSNGTSISYTDTTASPSSYTVNGNNDTFAPNLSFWPGSVILGPPAVTYGAHYVGSCGVTAFIVSGVRGLSTPVAKCNDPTQLDYVGDVLPVSSTPIQQEGAWTPNGYLGALLMPFGYGNYSPLAAPTKGVINFGNFPFVSAGATDVLTLYDSTPALTDATPGNRPLASTSDTAIGFDQYVYSCCSTGLFFRDPASVSSYIGHLPDNASWLERLTSTTKTIKTPNFLLAALSGLPGSGNYCLQIGSTGAITPTGAACAQGTISNSTPTTTNGVLAGNGANVQAATSAQMQAAIGTGVYDASGAAAARGGTGTCAAGQYETGDTTGGPSCAQVQYSQVGGTLNIPSTVPQWQKASFLFIANGVGGCANATGCVQVTATNGTVSVSAVPTAANAYWYFTPAQAYLSVEKVRIVPTAQCSGSTGLYPQYLGDYTTSALWPLSGTSTLLTTAPSGANQWSYVLPGDTGTIASDAISLRLAVTSGTLDQTAAGCGFNVYLLLSTNQ